MCSNLEKIIIVQEFKGVRRIHQISSRYQGLNILENSEHDTTQLSALTKNNLRFEFNSSLYKNLVL